MNYNYVFSNPLIGIGIGIIATIVVAWVQNWATSKQMKRNYLSKEFITIKEEFYITGLLSKEILETDFVPDLIVGLAPGGAMISEWLSRKFFLKKHGNIEIATIWVSINRDPNKLESKTATVDLKYKDLFSNLPMNSKILLVVDVIRSGNSLKAAYEFISQFVDEQNIIPACLFCNEHVNFNNLICVDKSPKPIRFEWKKYSFRKIKFHKNAA